MLAVLPQGEPCECVSNGGVDQGVGHPAVLTQEGGGEVSVLVRSTIGTDAGTAGCEKHASAVHGHDSMQC
jgi:hypothetical protein